MTEMRTSPKTARVARELMATAHRDGDGLRPTRAQAARLMRALLEATFPGTKFWVRTSNYAGGGSVDAFYHGARPEMVDGDWRQVPVPGAPTRGDVEDVVKAFGGTDFDGSVDGTFYHRSYLMPSTGRVVYGGTPGTAPVGRVDRVDVEPPPGGVPMRLYGYVMVNTHPPDGVKRGGS